MIMRNCVFLDSASMHPVIPPARDAFLLAPLGNPSSEHDVGQRARDALEQAREKIAALLDCWPQDVYFTSTATEAAALAMYSLAQEDYICDPSDLEHHAVSENATAFPMKHADSHWPGYAYAEMMVQNETGEKFLSHYPAKGIWLCDATAAVGHIPVSFRTLGCDYLLFDGIKFGSVPGAAALIAKKGAPLTPLIRGGGQERGMRSGTENVPAICAMAAALEWQCEHMEANTFKLNTLSDVMRQEISEIPNIQWNTPFDKPHVPHILNISFGGVDAHALALLLSKDGVMVSAGAACSNGKNEPSHVIMNMFHDEARARSAIRISFCNENTVEEVREAAEKIKNAVAYLRSLN